MDMTLIGGAAVGLVMGSFGYVLVRFGLRPLMAYRRLKRRLKGIVDTAAREKALAEDAREALRHSAVKLQDLLDDGLPVWYKLALERRAERPEEAVRHMQTLANCREPAAIRQRAEAVQQSLRL